MVSFFALALCFTAALAQWGTFYAFGDGQIYMHLKNNDLISLNFSITGFSNLDQYSSYSEDEINISNNQKVTLLRLPPTNSSVFLYHSDLYAFTAGDRNSEFDLCGNGVFQLLKYDSNLDSWGSAGDNMTFSGVNDVSFYTRSTYLVGDSSTVYIYGGDCSGTATSRMLSFDMESFSFSNISTSTKPTAFYGASSLWAPNPQNLLVIGGRANLGWISMLQMASWNFNSGWLFSLAKQNGTIESRVEPLALPVFSALSDNSTTTFANDYKPSAVLLLGGENGDSADPEWAKLSLHTNEWSWEALTTALDLDEVLGAATIFNTLVIVNSSSSKRDTSYLLNLYDISNNFEIVSSLKSALSTKPSSSLSSGTTITQKALIGTLVPLAAIALVAALGMFLWKRKMKAEDESVFEGDYQLGHFRTALEPHYSSIQPAALYHHHNDTGSTLEVASMESWVRKRQEFDTKRRTLIRHSFLASNETLNQAEVEEDRKELLPLAPPKAAFPTRMSHLTKSFSYSHTPPSLPFVKRRAKHDPSYIGLEDLEFTEENIDEPETSSLDEEMDVQVLVSSKRKSVLRIVNPDVSGEEEIRQRTPST